MSANRRIEVLALAAVLLGDVALVGSCDRRNELPVKYMICDGHGKDCKLFARFNDLESCQQRKTYGNALCDSLSTPGRIVCNTAVPASTTSSSTCVLE